MFFYLLHLYVLKLLYLACVALFGLNHGDYFGFDGITAVWLGAAAFSGFAVLAGARVRPPESAPPRHHLAEVLLKSVFTRRRDGLPCGPPVSTTDVSPS